MPGLTRIRLLLGEDQAMLRGALAALLSLRAPDVEIVAQARDGEEAIALARRAAPDVALLGVGLPRTSGLRAAEILRGELPLLRVVLLATRPNPAQLRRTLAAGASGYLLADAPSADLAEAIRRAAQGERVIPPELAGMAGAPDEATSSRERDVLRLADGRPARAVAQALHVPEVLVRASLREVVRKLGAADRRDARRIALERGWL